ncbi:hypothetical protein [Haloprofundus salinisoli]|uniref:hypothetical protein n=1 Tax=Haloprofundus salinisoli TaxID=2876193 RepID=UPI001CCA5F92|nr:hypothetical protein [Haloprofundus salinisoli]
MTAEDDDLQRSTRRLGDRFGAATDTSDRSRRSVEETDEESAADSGAESASSAESDPRDETDSESETDKEPEWVPTTLYLPEETRREFRRFLKRLTLDYPEIESAKKRELHTALVQIGMEQSGAVAERTDELSSDDN